VRGQEEKEKTQEHNFRKIPQKEKHFLEYFT
jgi:hypothetical protein